LDEETDDSDDSFDIFKVGMDTGELDGVSFICKSSDNGNNGSNGDEDNLSVAGDSSDFSDSSSGEEETRAKHLRKPTKKWKEGRKLALKVIKVFDDSNVGIQVLHI